MKSRVFNCMQYEYNPVSGEDLHFNESNIISCISHKMIKRWAYICHDKDVFSEADEIANVNHKAGETKPRHWHVVIEFGSRQVELSVVAKWLGVPENMINIAKGHGAFLDCVQYLTHEDEAQQLLGKVKYDDGEVKANFDFRKELNLRADRLLKYGKDLSEDDQVKHDVLFNGKTLSYCREHHPLVYMNNMLELKRMRLDYLRSQPAPKTRLNYYISGEGGMGKGLCSKALARSLCKQMYPELTKDDEIFHTVDDPRVAFDKYDGQPVIIWNDCRAVDLLNALGSRSTVFNVFDTFPTSTFVNIKYGSVNLINSINIVNSVQEWDEFLKGLAGEFTSKSGELVKAEDRGQAYRRFPMIIPLREKDFDVLLNRGFYDGSGAWEQYIQYKNIKGNFGRVRKLLSGYPEETIVNIESEMLTIPSGKGVELLEKTTIIDIDSIPDELKEFGKGGDSYEQLSLET